MAVGTQPGRTSAPTGLPAIPMRTGEEREREQIQYLIWRLGLFLKDAGASMERREEFRNTIVAAWRRGTPYAGMVRLIEEQMNGFLAKQVANIQSIYNEK